MLNLTLGKNQWPPALLVASEGAIEVAAFATKSGDKMVCNANLEPFSPIDGTPMQKVSAKAATVSADKLNRLFVTVGTCNACTKTLKATASLADALETAGEDFACPFCSASVPPVIDGRKLTLALAEEYNDDDEDSEAGDDAVDDDQDVEGDDAGDDDTEAEDEGDGEDAGDDESVDDEDDEDKDETAAVVAAIKGKKAKKAIAGEGDCDEDGDMSDDSEDTKDADMDGDDEEFAAAVASLRETVKKMGLASEDDEDGSNDEESDDGGESADGDDGDWSETEDEGDDDAEGEDKGEEASDDQPKAGQATEDAAIDKMNDEARAALRARRGNKPDGNRRMKSTKALSSNTEGDSTVAEQGITPGSNKTTGEENTQEKTPGNGDKTQPNTDHQEKTPGTNENAMAGDMLVEWTTAKVELVTAGDDNVRWVFANGQPVATLNKGKATAGIVAQWSKPALTASFVATCARGLPPAEAAEFGFAPHKFEVQANDAMRTAMHRMAFVATENSKKEVARNQERYQQSLRTAVVAAFKGAFPDLKNPIKDVLVANLTKLSVAEPRSVVDTAIATAADAFLVGVFAKADEIAAKSDEARNEVATFVASASFQNRIDDASGLAAKLAEGNSKMVAAASVATQTKVVETETATDTGENMRRAIRSLPSVRRA